MRGMAVEWCKTLIKITMARKRSCEELNCPIASTQIHGVITSLSPIKKKRKSLMEP